MDPQVQAFKDKMAEKAAVKNDKVLPAVAAGDWATVAKEGINGTEGKLFAEAEAIAKKFVADKPDTFAIVAAHSDPSQPLDEKGLSGHDKLVGLIDLFRQAGDDESATLLTMYELAKFERQQIGVQTRAKVRIGNGD